MVGGVDIEYDSDGNIIDVVQGDGIDPLELASQVEEIWNRYDEDGNGFLDKFECRMFLEDYKAEHPLIELDMSDDKKFEKVFAHIDTDNSGQIDKEEMTYFIKILIHMEKSSDIKLLMSNAIQANLVATM